MMIGRWSRWRMLNFMIATLIDIRLRKDAPEKSCAGQDVRRSSEILLSRDRR